MRKEKRHDISEQRSTVTMQNTVPIKMPLRSKAAGEKEIGRLARDLAGKVFEVSKTYPPDERFPLTEPMRRASRSVAVNSAAVIGGPKRRDHLEQSLFRAAGSLEETKVWLNFSRMCGYLSERNYLDLIESYDVLDAKICDLRSNPGRIHRPA